MFRHTVYTAAAAAANTAIKLDISSDISSDIYACPINSACCQWIAIY